MSAMATPLVVAASARCSSTSSTVPPSALIRTASAGSVSSAGSAASTGAGWAATRATRATPARSTVTRS